MRNNYERHLELEKEYKDNHFLIRLVFQVTKDGQPDFLITIEKYDNKTTGAKTLVLRDTLNDVIQIETFYIKEWQDMNKLSKELQEIINQYLDSIINSQNNIKHIEELFELMEG